MRIRLAKPEDAGHLRAIYAPVVSDTHISFEERVPTVAEMEGRIAAAATIYPWLVAEEHSIVAGYAYAGRHRARPGYRWSVESSIFVDAEFRGRGIAKRLYAELFQILTRQRFHTVFAGIALPNDASIALHRATGFEQIGVFPEVGYKLGAWHDASWWRRALSNANPPQEPIPLADLPYVPFCPPT